MANSYNPDEAMKRYKNLSNAKLLRDKGPLSINGQMRAPPTPLIIMEDANSPVIDTSNPNVGFGEEGNIFPGGPFERKALMKMYGGTGSENAKRALAEDNRLMKEYASKGEIGPPSQLAQGQAEFDLAKRQRLEKQMKMKDPSDYYNPPQRQVSLGQLLGK